MPRSKRAAEQTPILWYLSANTNSREGRYIQVGNSLLLSKKFQELSRDARYLYQCLAMEAGGKSAVEFPEKAFTKYGIPVRTGRRLIEELVRKGFIARNSGWTTREPNIYTFLPWKSDQRDL